MIKKTSCSFKIRGSEFAADPGQTQGRLGLPSAHIPGQFHCCEMIQIYYYHGCNDGKNVSAIHLNPLLVMRYIL